MDRLVLWDVDGTLLSAGGVGAAVFDRALAVLLGRTPPERIHMSGRTDPQIAAEYLAMLGVPDPDEVLPGVLVQLEKELVAAEDELRASGHAMPGVAALIARLHGEPGVLQSLLTGNIAPNAVVKLAAFGLDELLDLEVGAYGSDHADRNELVPIALARVEERRGRRFSTDEVWVVGDSPNDLACARAGGVRCLLVGTGRYGVDELVALGPDAALADLADTDRAASILLG